MVYLLISLKETKSQPSTVPSTRFTEASHALHTRFWAQERDGLWRQAGAYQKWFCQHFATTLPPALCTMLSHAVSRVKGVAL
jgi:hypothetical protein